MRSRSRLLVEPQGQPLLDLGLGQDSRRPDVSAAAADALQDVEVVLDVLKRGLLGEAVEDSSGVLLRGCHRIQGTARRGGRKGIWVVGRPGSTDAVGRLTCNW